MEVEPHSLAQVEHMFLYFDLEVLASYRAQPDKYVIDIDDFEGSVTVRDDWYASVASSGTDSDPYMRVRFGYRVLSNGKSALVALGHDLQEAKTHHRIWGGFLLDQPSWRAGPDPRFAKWFNRYIEADWAVENGPRSRLSSVLALVNGITQEAGFGSLYKHGINAQLQFPLSQNSHAYQDSHTQLYGYLIDGLDKGCLASMAANLGVSLKISNSKSVTAFGELIPEVGLGTPFRMTMDKISEQRRLASHGVRPAAVSFEAYEIFTSDLSQCAEQLEALVSTLEVKFNIDGASALKRNEARERLMKMVADVNSGASIRQIAKTCGKTIEKAEFGQREHIDGVHQSELILLHFTDGSILEIDTGSNAGNLESTEREVKAVDFHVDFMLAWVPALAKRH